MNFIRIGGIVFFIMSIFSTKRDIEELYVAQNGELIEAIILSTPSNCNLRNNLTTFKSISGKIFKKQMDKSFCLNSNVGDKAKFIIHNSYPEIYCLPNIENWLKSQIISGLVIFILSLSAIYFSFKVKKQ